MNIDEKKVYIVYNYQNVYIKNKKYYFYIIFLQLNI